MFVFPCQYALSSSVNALETAASEAPALTSFVAFADKFR